MITEYPASRQQNIPPLCPNRITWLYDRWWKYFLSRNRSRVCTTSNCYCLLFYFLSFPFRSVRFSPFFYPFHHAIPSRHDTMLDTWCLLCGAWRLIRSLIHICSCICIQSQLKARLQSTNYVESGIDIGSSSSLALLLTSSTNMVDATGNTIQLTFPIPKISSWFLVKMFIYLCFIVEKKCSDQLVLVTRMILVSQPTYLP